MRSRRSEAVAKPLQAAPPGSAAAAQSLPQRNTRTRLSPLSLLVALPLTKKILHYNVRQKTFIIIFNMTRWCFSTIYVRRFTSSFVLINLFICLKAEKTCKNLS